MPAKRSKRSSARPSTEKTHSCNECGQAFRRKSDLKRHLMLHSPNKDDLKHKCPYPGCSHRTLLKGNLETHYNARHLGLKPFECRVDDDCGQTFGDGSSLVRHERFVHGYCHKEGVFLPGLGKTSPSGGRAPAQMSTLSDATTQDPSEEVAAMQQLFDFSWSSQSASSSSSPTNDGSSGFFTPSPSPGLPSPGSDTFQSQYPQQMIYPDVATLENAIPFDITLFDRDDFDSFQQMDLLAPSQPDFIQGCFAMPSLYPPAHSDVPDMPLPFVPDATSFVTLSTMP